MNHTKYGNIAVGAEGSIARIKSDMDFLSQKLREQEEIREQYESGKITGAEYRDLCKSTWRRERIC